MSSSNTVMINGRAYDAATGLPATSAAKIANNMPKKGKTFSDIGPRRVAVTGAQPVNSTTPHSQPPASVAAAPRQSGVAYTNIHHRTQKSQTLYRAALKRPETTVSTAANTKSPQITKFGAPSVPTKAPEIKPEPVAVKVPVTQTLAAQPAKPQHLSGTSLKERLIKDKIAEAEAIKRKKPKHTTGRFKAFMQRQPRVASVATVTLALLILGGYITYVNLPNLSVRVAAAQAGINASYPQYQPDGYSLNGPVAYAPGEVTLNFQSNSNNEQDYTIKQRASSWDSQAVLDNYVSKETGTYLTYSERGLTVYTYGSKAAWVNGGILYTLNGNAPLNSDQILKIASSM
ncbi:MAG TPA: hypothetical protein VH144_01715 [Candidatus Saccharimonadales bacterium]|nr:hypothetical protein [Candidatus Saccharimonadales bacterium]